MRCPWSWRSGTCPVNTSAHDPRGRGARPRVTRAPAQLPPSHPFFLPKGTDDAFYAKASEAYPGTAVVIVLYSISVRGTFESALGRWVPEMKENLKGVPVVLVATKGDLRKDEDTKRFLRQTGKPMVSEDEVGSRGRASRTPHVAHLHHSRGALMLLRSVERRRRPKWRSR